MHPSEIGHSLVKGGDAGSIGLRVAASQEADLAVRPCLSLDPARHHERADGDSQESSTASVHATVTGPIASVDYMGTAGF